MLWGLATRDAGIKKYIAKRALLAYIRIEEIDEKGIKESRERKNTYNDDSTHCLPLL